jgi:hypothetical protein
VSESPAETLRRAAKLMRERADAAPKGHWPALPWGVEDCEHGCPCVVYHGEYAPFDEPQVPLIQFVCDAETPEHAEHIASWHPLAAAAVAGWLEAEAADAAVFPLRFPQALAVARAYLGEPS